MDIEIIKTEEKADWEGFIKFLCKKFKEWEFENENDEAKQLQHNFND